MSRAGVVQSDLALTNSGASLLCEREREGERERERGRERERERELWLEGRVLEFQWADGGDLPKGSRGQTHIWGLSKAHQPCEHPRLLPRGFRASGPK